MQLDRAWMLRHLPHQGAMCLLDEVVRWDAAGICCRSGTHHAADNPLRDAGRLGVACGIEYAAQAMALHAALLAGAAEGAANAERPAVGFLASVRGVHFHATQLDAVPGDLLCQALRVAGDANGALYEFDVSSGDRLLLGGRAAVVLDADGRLTS
jgi:predicted hotdog family 3-hydroxylacyl-ACP dehydratase